MKKLLTLAAAAMALFISGCGPAGPIIDPDATPTPVPVEISCYISPELSGVLNDIYKKYNEDYPGLIITFNADSTEKLEDGIRNNEGCDIIFSSSKESIKSLDASGHIISDSVTPMLCNSVVFICQGGKKAEITKITDLPKAKTAAIAPKNTLLGGYSYELMDKFDVSLKTDEYRTTEEIINAVAEGDSDVGIIYATDAALAGDDVKTITDPTTDTSVITGEYTMALVSNSNASSQQQTAAKSFFKYLTSNAARNSFVYYGFTME